MSRHMLSYMSKFTRILFHLAALCDSLRCGAYGTYCYDISRNVIINKDKGCLHLVLNSCTARGPNTSNTT